MLVVAVQHGVVLHVIGGGRGCGWGDAIAQCRMHPVVVDIAQVIRPARLMVSTSHTYCLKSDDALLIAFVFFLVNNQLQSYT